MILNSPTISGSLTVTGNIIASGSITLSGSVASASYALSASNAQTASFANAFTVAGNLTAQTLVVQTITSSVDYVTGSTQFGSILNNTHIFSGSVTMNPNGLFVSSSGVVGIGTTTPTQKLHVFGAGDGTKGRFELYGVGGINEVLQVVNTANYNPDRGVKIGFYVNSGSNASQLGAEIGSAVSDVTSTYLYFSTTNTGITSEKMRINAAGNMGIGTTVAANARFNVYMNDTDPIYTSKIQAVFGPSTYQDSDATQLHGGGTSETQFLVGNTSRPAMISLGGNINAAETVGVINFFRSANTDSYRSRAQIFSLLNNTGTADRYGAYLAFSTAADGATNPSERMRIGSTGNVTLSSKDTNISINEMLQGSISYYRANLDDDHTAVKILNGSYTFNTYLIDIVLTNGDSVDAYATIWANIQGNTQVSSTIIGGLNTGYFAIINETSAPPTGTDGKFNIILNGQDGNSWFYVRNRLGGTRRTAIMIKQLLPR
jgi:hypothetical protein